MADDNNARYRPNDSFGRGPAQAAPASDPLAELARLIGRNDPFAEYAREPQPPAQPDTGAAYDSRQDPARHTAASLRRDVRRIEPALPASPAPTTPQRAAPHRSHDKTQRR